MDNTILVPLSSVDQAGVESSLSVFGYVVPTSSGGGLSVPLLKSACLRLVDKWRLIAGQIVWVPTTSSYAISVPLGPIDPSSRLHFTSTEERGCLDLQGGEMGGSEEAKTVKTPSMKYFVHKDTVGPLAACAKRGAPILNVHVARFEDYTCIGIATPHGVFDGTGQGALTQYLDAEIHGREYTLPPLQPLNILQTAFDSFNSATPPASPSAYDSTIDKAKGALENLKRELVQSGVKSVAALAGRVGYEYLWHRAEDRALFLGKNAIEKIVSKVKSEVKALDPSGSSFVSTGDVLYMWLVQTACADEAADETHTVGMMSAISMRPILSEVNEDFATYPHNCIVPMALPLTNKAATKNTPLAQLALTHRRAIDDARNLPYIQNWSRHINLIGSSVPDRRWRHDSWIMTNQSVARSTDIRFPSTKTVGFFYYFTPILPDHTIMMNELNGGIVMQGPVRRSRWNAIDRALAELMKA
ncbi:hypothetical protein EXIGLDRAFT_611314 [Exidia glandulosa HHB12029]|uniref:Uncharacterized protein n=1 Tax=Exidia glandulosa HHB12029 TaxID=1314781 RepID=A0A165JGB2_EXIGL|nr:hypothetical protein EXIGLDRAFT_611314 [Exidia glandulosa HHB12029]